MPNKMFTEYNKIQNALAPALQCSGHGAPLSAASGVTDTDVYNMENYKRCTFIVSFGATMASHDGKLRVFAGGTTLAANVATPCDFYYRTQLVSGGAAATTDQPSALTAGTTDGILIGTALGGGQIFVEVDAPTVAAAGSTGGVDFHRFKLRFAHTSTVSAPRYMGITAILSEPRYPQDVLVTAID